MTTWKAVEREVARRLGGRRVPITGRQRGDVPDIEHDWLAIEVKHRGKLPAWLENAMQQAELCSENGRKLPIAVLHEAGQWHGYDLVVMRLESFENWFGGMGDADGGEANEAMERTD